MNKFSLPQTPNNEVLPAGHKELEPRRQMKCRFPLQLMLKAIGLEVLSQT